MGGFSGDWQGGSSAEPNAEANVLGPQSQEWTSATVVLTWFLAWDDIFWDMDVLVELMVLLLKEYT